MWQQQVLLRSGSWGEEVNNREKRSKAVLK
jgi:hypothetical protein